MKLLGWKRIPLAAILAFLGTGEASAIRSFPNCTSHDVVCIAGTSMKLLLTDLLFWPLLVLQEIFHPGFTDYDKTFYHGGALAVFLWYYMLLSFPNARAFVALIMAMGGLIYVYQRYV